MHGFKEDFVPERKHRSADDLDDGFVYNILTCLGTLTRAPSNA
jgi:hypothetical protein